MRDKIIFLVIFVALVMVMMSYAWKDQTVPPSVDVYLPHSNVYLYTDTCWGCHR